MKEKEKELGAVKDNRGARHKFLAGSLCLDFTNTVHHHGFPDEVDDLRDHCDLVSWGQQSGVLDKDEATALIRRASRYPVVAKKALHRAKALRDLLRRIFAAVATGNPAKEAEVDALNEFVGRAMTFYRVVPGPEGFEWGWVDESDSLERVLWPVIESAADLLVGGQLERVRECSLEGCTALFQDTSKNNRRRWCDMTDCGNLVKSRRHYGRSRSIRRPLTVSPRKGIGLAKR